MMLAHSFFHKPQERFRKFAPTSLCDQLLFSIDFYQVFVTGTVVGWREYGVFIFSRGWGALFMYPYLNLVQLLNRSHPTKVISVGGGQWVMHQILGYRLSQKWDPSLELS